MNESIKLLIGDREIIIEKIPLGKYPAIIESLQGLAKHKELFSDISGESIMQSLPQILIVATPEAIKVIHTITGVEEEAISKWGLDDLVRCVEAIFEVNDFNYVYGTLKKAMSQLNLKKPEMAKTEATDGVN